MRVVSVCGFRKRAATTLEIIYLQSELSKLGHGFRLIVFDDEGGRDIRAAGSNRFMAMAKVLPMLMRDEFDIVQIVKASPYVGIPALLAARLKRKRCVVVLDDYERGITTKRHGRVAGAIMGLLEDMIIRFSDHVICASEFLFEKAKGLNRSCTFIPFGIPADRFRGAKNIRNRLGLSNDDRVVVYVGSLTRDADVDIAIEAMKYVDCKLLVVGGGEAENDFKALAGELGVAGKVIFCGWQDFDNVPDFISSSDVCVIPMREMDIDRARCPMKLLEYIAADKPVVGSDIGMVSFFLKHGAGLLCRPDDPKDMGERVSDAMSEKVRRDTKKGIMDLKREYSWPKVAERYLEAYKEVLR
jgi:glycosyltransferase involved in cell wall biosynthesis